MKSKFVNPYTDFGFKKIFGEEASKPMLIDFLNALLPEQRSIVDVQFRNAEQLGGAANERKAVYDIYCENERGEKFIVELQKAKQNYFKERSVYYASFPIRQQGERGDWQFGLKAVYCIGILDFVFNDPEATEAEQHDVVHMVQLKNQHHRVFYDKLTFIYLEMPNFNKGEHALETRLDKWLYFIKHLTDFEKIPSIFKDKVFEQAFQKAALANLDENDVNQYEQSLKQYRDLKGVIDYAYLDGMENGRLMGMEEGKQMGMLEGKKQLARQMIAAGADLNLICTLTGFTKEELGL